eukprot:TRINITY_DN18662_c0_g1_i1.p2 TRINITY_DN18662_c0_g1~~TRINITY_DN18662_c0_g1_i1.p2  ORF type:complete len:136 (-),score=8.90 TRINITY_DN18662_c0_g1_i1:47-454(-)
MFNNRLNTSDPVRQGPFLQKLEKAQSLKPSHSQPMIHKASPNQSKTLPTSPVLPTTPVPPPSQQASPTPQQAPSPAPNPFASIFSTTPTKPAPARLPFMLTRNATSSHSVPSSPQSARTYNSSRFPSNKDLQSKK